MKKGIICFNLVCATISVIIVYFSIIQSNKILCLAGVVGLAANILNIFRETRK